MEILNRMLRLSGAAIVLIAMVAGCSLQHPADQVMQQILIESLSNRADLISGGDALLEIELPSGMTLDQLTIELNGKEISNPFARRDDGRIVGVINGLGNGVNVITTHGGDLATQLTLTNHSRGGPVFSGPQIEPWICATTQAQKGDDETPSTLASGLSTEATDAQCNIAAEVKRYYRTLEQCGRDPADRRNWIPCFKEYPVDREPPVDLATTINQHGETIPYIVRIERGTINRGIYDIAVVEEEGAEWGPLHQNSTWNGALVHIFGGSTGTPRLQSPPNSRWSMDEALSRGFMVSVSSLTDQALNSNKIVAAEMLMMLKEHIAERYGEISHTIGFGCSGGSIMQLVIAATYPGILDGILPACTYPDSVTTGIEVTECVLLENYFKSDAFGTLIRELNESEVQARKAAIAGHLDSSACIAWSRSFGHANNPGNFMRNEREMNNCYLPRNWVFDPESNPNGVRCSQSDHEIAVWGREPGQDYGRRVSDNSGVLYGLKAAEQGKISTEEFVTLNEKIGGNDVDRGLVPERTRASADSIGQAYRMGLVTDARQWAKTPIIDLRGNDNSGIHMNWRSFAVRDRLDRTLGHHDNQVIWRYGPELGPPTESTLIVDALETMDAWVRAIKADNSSLSIEERVVKNKPVDAYDFCYIDDDYKTRITDWERCNADPILAYYSSPRQVASGPLAENVLKCATKPLVRTDDSLQFSDAQWQRLQAVFPDGVCDWSVPGVGMQPAIPWLDYSDGPGGKPIPAAPHSVSK